MAQKTPKRPKLLSVPVTEEMYDALSFIASREDCSLARLARKAVDAFIEEDRRERR